MNSNTEQIKPVKSPPTQQSKATGLVQSTGLLALSLALMGSVVAHQAKGLDSPLLNNFAQQSDKAAGALSKGAFFLKQLAQSSKIQVRDSQGRAMTLEPQAQPDHLAPSEDSSQNSRLVVGPQPTVQISPELAAQAMIERLQGPRGQAEAKTTPKSSQTPRIDDLFIADQILSALSSATAGVSHAGHTLHAPGNPSALSALSAQRDGSAQTPSIEPHLRMVAANPQAQAWILDNLREQLDFDRELAEASERNTNKKWLREHGQWMQQSHDWLEGENTKRPFTLKADPHVLRLIAKAADRHGVPKILLASLVEQESQFRTDAVSRVGATGLGQVMPSTAIWLETGSITPSDSDLQAMSQRLLNPQYNLNLAARYLKKLSDRFDGNLDLVLAAYNAGPGNVVKFNGEVPFAETQAYGERIKAKILIRTKDMLLTLSEQEQYFVQNDVDLEDSSRSPTLN